LQHKDRFRRDDDGTNTTVMFANIPDGLPANQVVDSLDDAGFQGMYDYFRLKVSPFDPFLFSLQPFLIFYLTITHHP